MTDFEPGDEVILLNNAYNAYRTDDISTFAPGSIGVVLRASSLLVFVDLLDGHERGWPFYRGEIMLFRKKS